MDWGFGEGLGEGGIEGLGEGGKEEGMDDNWSKKSVLMIINDYIKLAVYGKMAAGKQAWMANIES